jgi:hypothetical protein
MRVRVGTANRGSEPQIGTAEDQDRRGEPTPAMFRASNPPGDRDPSQPAGCERARSFPSGSRLQNTAVNSHGA